MLNLARFLLFLAKVSSHVVAAVPSFVPVPAHGCISSMCTLSNCQIHRRHSKACLFLLFLYITAALPRFEFYQQLERQISPRSLGSWEKAVRPHKQQGQHRNTMKNYSSRQIEYKSKSHDFAPGKRSYHSAQGWTKIFPTQSIAYKYL